MRGGGGRGAEREHAGVRGAPRPPLVLSSSLLSSPLFLTLSWPPTSQAVKESFLYSTFFTLKPGEEEGGGGGRGEGAVVREMRAARSGKRTAKTGAPFFSLSPPALPGHAAPLLTNRGDGRHDLAQIQLVQDGGLTRGVEPDLGRERRGGGGARGRENIKNGQRAAGARERGDQRHGRPLSSVRRSRQA